MTTVTERVCCVPRCDCQVHVPQLFCGDHWDKLPEDLQYEVFAAWTRLRARLPGSKEQLLGLLVDAAVLVMKLPV
jgi:hypothetical protein